MAESDEVRFACPGCGAWNGAGADGCWSCGHRFVPTEPAAPSATPAPPPPTAPPARFNPYGPPTAHLSSAGSSQIGSVLMFTALVAVCLGTIRTNSYMGMALTVSVLPATIRTYLVGARCKAEGRPMDLGGQFETFVKTLGAVYLICGACLITFFVTCLPVGGMTNSLNTALTVGVVAAISCGIWVTSMLLAGGRRRAEREQERERARDREIWPR